MKIQIDCLEGVLSQTHLHKHTQHEILLFSEGSGIVETSVGKYSFSPGTTVVIPPMTEHRTTSGSHVKYYYISGDFRKYLNLDAPIVLHDNEKRNGLTLTDLIYQNRFNSTDYLSALVDALILFIVENLKVDNKMNHTILHIIQQISEQYCDCKFSVGMLLKDCGYAEDYVRAHFKRFTEKTPGEFLCELRIRRALYLIETYRATLSLSEICEMCGFSDYVYFSKRFKQYVGISPREFRNSL